MVKITKKGDKVWVTFTLPVSEDTTDVHVIGEWSEWTHEPMKQKKNGEYAITKVFNSGKCFEFGYKINGDRWEKDEELPSVMSPFGSYNSLLSL